MGKVMKAVQTKVAGRADNRLVSPACLAKTCLCPRPWA